LGFAIGEQVHESIAILIDYVGDEVWLVLDDAPEHGYALVALNPVCALDVGVNGGEQLLV
jgi:hypothetical protein